MAKPKTSDSPNIAIKEREKSKKPPMYKVLIHNDDYTPMDFVVYVLTKHFQHDEASATQIMLNVHNKGVGIAGVFTKDVAETKSLLVNKEARENEHPLKTTTERE